LGLFFACRGRHLWLTRVTEGKFAVRAKGSKRASGLRNTRKQAEALVKKLNPNDKPNVERVRDTEAGLRDLWRSEWDLQAPVSMQEQYMRMTIAMNAVQIVKVEKDGPDGILVTFSDGTIAGYVAEELIELRPIRERVKFFPSAWLPETTRQAHGGRNRKGHHGELRH
jgi:hypothetical protein